MTKYTSISQREAHTAPLPRRTESPYREPQFLWAFSLIALCPDGETYVHAATYIVKPSGEQANDAGWYACLRDFPKSEGFTKHDVSMMQIDPRHVAKANGGLA